VQKRLGEAREQVSYTEDNYVEKPAINLFSSIGWETLDCYSETFGPESLLGRENRSEVVLTRELRAALNQINPDCTSNEIELAVEELNRDRSAMSDMAANEAGYKLIRDGVKVKANTDKIVARLRLTSASFKTT